MIGIIVRVLINALGLWLATTPITLLSLGGFLLVINAGMVALVGWLIEGFHVAGFLPALVAGLVISVTSWLASRFVGPKGRYEVLVIERRR